MKTRILVLLAACAPALVACGDKAADAAPAEATAALTVELATPSKESWPQRVVASGHVAAWQEASVGSELNGIRLEEVRVNVGDVVAKGQVLARFNEDTLRADLARLEAAVSEARANRDKAVADAEKGAALDAKGAISKSDYSQLQTNAKVAEARVESAVAQRDAQTLQLRRARVVAPDAGVISARNATVGAVVSAGTELFRLIRQGRLEWRAQVRADAMPLLKPGERVEIEQANGPAIEGVVRQIAPSVDPETLTGIVYVDLPLDSGLAAGLFVSGSFSLASTDALTLPESALVFREGHRYVMKVGKDMRIKTAKVRTGRSQGGEVEILDGLALTDRVALSGGAFLNEGDLVQVRGQSTNQKAASR